MGLEFPNLPYFIDGDFAFTEVVAIQKYIAGKWGPELLGRDVTERGQVAMIASIVGDVKGGTTQGCYLDGDRAILVKTVFDKVPPLIKFLGNKPYLVGDQVTWVDFFFVELVDFMNFLTEGQLIINYPVLQRYFERVMSLPGLKEFWNSEYCIKRPFNNKIAKINN